MLFFHESFPDYYEKTSLAAQPNGVFGGIYWTHTYYPHERLEVWRPTDRNPASTRATTFQIETAGGDAFKSLPLASPHLKSNEEFLVIRAKPRPVILLVPQIDVNEKRLQSGGVINRRHCLVAPVFSINEPNSRESKFRQEFIDNVRRLMYPNFMYLPMDGGPLTDNSLLRLDCCQSVFTDNLTSLEYKLSPMVADLMRSQFFYLCDQVDDGNYTTWRETCLEGAE